MGTQFKEKVVNMVLVGPVNNARTHREKRFC